MTFQPSKVQLLIVTPGYPPAVGGIEVVASQTARGFAQRGVAVTVLAQTSRSLGRPSAEPEDIAAGIEVRFFRDSFGIANFPVALSLIREMRHSSTLFDIIHTHSFHAAPSLISATFSHAPHVFSPHYHGVGHAQLARYVHLVYDDIARLTIHRASAIVCVSESEAEHFLRRYPLATQKIRIVPNGVDIKAIRNGPRLEFARPTLLVVGRLEEYKQVQLVIEAMRYLPGDVQLVIVGDGPYRKRLEYLAFDLRGSQRVNFTGAISDSELRLYQRSASAAVSLSRHEAFGLVIAEAAVAGMPIVATDIPAHRETARIARVAPQYVKVDASPLIVARSITDALDSKRSSISDDALNELSWEGVLNKLFLVYEDVLNGG